MSYGYRKYYLKKKLTKRAAHNVCTATRLHLFSTEPKGHGCRQREGDGAASASAPGGARKRLQHDEKTLQLLATISNRERKLIRVGNSVPPVATELTIEKSLVLFRYSPVAAELAIEECLVFFSDSPVAAEFAIEEDLILCREPPVTPELAFEEDFVLCGKIPVASELAFEENLIFNVQSSVTSELTGEKGLILSGQVPVASELTPKKDLILSS